MSFVYQFQGIHLAIAEQSTAEQLTASFNILECNRSPFLLFDSQMGDSLMSPVGGNGCL